MINKLFIRRLLTFHSPLVLKNVAYKIVIFRIKRKIIVPAALDANQGNPIRVQLLKINTVFNWDQPVFRTMQDVNRAFHLFNPLIGSQFKSQYELNR